MDALIAICTVIDFGVGDGNIFPILFVCLRKAAKSKRTRTSCGPTAATGHGADPEEQNPAEQNPAVQNPAVSDTPNHLDNRRSLQSINKKRPQDSIGTSKPRYLLKHRSSRSRVRSFHPRGKKGSPKSSWGGQFSADGDAGDASVLNFGSVSASTDGDVQF